MSPLFRSGTVSLTFEPTETAAEAFALEETLIEQHNPEFNRTNKDGYRRYRMRRRQLDLEPKKKQYVPILDDATVQRLRKHDYY